MKDVEIKLRINCQNINEDPITTAKYLIEEMEIQLSIHIPALGRAYGQLIRGEIGTEGWLDPNE